MKRQSILFILLLLLTLTALCGCSSAKNAQEETAEAVPMEAALEEAIEESAAFEGSVTAGSDTDELKLESDHTVFENVTGIFEGLEDNHTALFSFDGVEVVFLFEAPEVQTVLSEAVIGSTYTLSYQYDSSRGLNVLYEISE